MMETAAPGWYPDGSGQRRYWDGTKWTISEAEYSAIAATSVGPQASAPTPASQLAPAVVRYKGRDGSLVIDGEFVAIEHNDGAIPDFRVHQNSITAVHFEPATRFVSGIVTIAVNGVPLVVPTGTACGSDPGTVVFKHAANKSFYDVQAWLRQIVAENMRRGQR